MHFNRGGLWKPVIDGMPIGFLVCLPRGGRDRSNPGVNPDRWAPGESGVGSEALSSPPKPRKDPRYRWVPVRARRGNVGGAAPPDGPVVIRSAQGVDQKRQLDPAASIPTEVNGPVLPLALAPLLREERLLSDFNPESHPVLSGIEAGPIGNPDGKRQQQKVLPANRGQFHRKSHPGGTLTVPGVLIQSVLRHTARTRGALNLADLGVRNLGLGKSSSRSVVTTPDSAPVRIGCPTTIPRNRRRRRIQ